MCRAGRRRSARRPAQRPGRPPGPRGRRTRSRVHMLGGLAGLGQERLDQARDSSRRPPRRARSRACRRSTALPCASMSQAVETATARDRGSGSAAGGLAASSQRALVGADGGEGEVGSLTRWSRRPGQVGHGVRGPESRRRRRDRPRPPSVRRRSRPRAGGPGLPAVRSRRPGSSPPSRLRVSVPARSNHAVVHADRSRPEAVRTRTSGRPAGCCPTRGPEVGAQSLDERVLADEGHQLLQDRSRP